MRLESQHRYILLPVNENLKHTVNVIFCVNGEPTYRLDVRLDPRTPTYTAYIDISRFRGTALTLEVRPQVIFTPTYADALDEAALYREDARPRVHFTAPYGWINDPNGLCKYEDTYHLFYQYNPADTVWGNMHWGHAVSKDLLHWQNKPIALYPDMHGTIYSGCAFVDLENKSGLGENGVAPILFYYTYNTPGRVQNLAYSTDGGETLKPYGGNPVVPHIERGNRDPKVIACPEVGGYLMALYLGDDRYVLLRSTELLHWEELQRLSLPGDNECPDIYPLTYEGVRYYVLKGAHSHVLLGHMSPNGFTPVEDVFCSQYDDTVNYASQSFEADGRRIDIAWHKKLTAVGAGFSGQMSVPMECSLCRIGGRLRLVQRPVKELEALRRDELCFSGHIPPDGWCFSGDAEALDLTLELPYVTGKTVQLSLFGEPVCLDMSQNTLCCGKASLPLCIEKKQVRLRVIADRLSLEIFADDGVSNLSVRTYADYNRPPLLLTGDAEVERLCAYSLERVYRK